MDRLVLPMGSVDSRREEVRTPHGKRIELRPRAFAVLRCLASHAERVVGKDDLLAECWPGTIVTEKSLTQCISDIREALGDSARDVIRTMPRRGYMLMPPAQPAPAVQPFAQGVTHLWPGVAVLPFELVRRRTAIQAPCWPTTSALNWRAAGISACSRDSSTGCLADPATACTGNSCGPAPASIACRCAIGLNGLSSASLPRDASAFGTNCSTMTSKTMRGLQRPGGGCLTIH